MSWMIVRPRKKDDQMLNAKNLNRLSDFDAVSLVEAEVEELALV